MQICLNLVIRCDNVNKKVNCVFNILSTKSCIGCPKKLGIAIFELEMVINQLFSTQNLKISTLSKSAESRLCEGSSKNGEH